MLRTVRKGQLATGFAGTQVCDPEEGPGWEPWRAERGYIRWGGGQVGGPSSLARPWARELTGWLPTGGGEPPRRLVSGGGTGAGLDPPQQPPRPLVPARAEYPGPGLLGAALRDGKRMDRTGRSRGPGRRGCCLGAPRSSGEPEKGASLRPRKPSSQDLERMGDRSRQGQGLPHSDGIFPPGRAARGPRGPEPDRHRRRYSKRARDCGRVRPPEPTWPALPSGPRLAKLLPGFLEPGELPGPLARRGALVCSCRLGSWNKAHHAVT